MRFFLLFLTILFVGCAYTSHPVIYYSHREAEILGKSFRAGEKLVFDQPTLRPFYLNGVFVTASLSYRGTEEQAPESGLIYSLAFVAKSYSDSAKIELKRLEIPGLPETSLSASGIIELAMVKLSPSAPYMQKHRDAGLHMVIHSVTQSIKEAGLNAVVAQNKRVKVVVLIAVTNNGQTEEREITYVFEGRTSGHFLPL